MTKGAQNLVTAAPTLPGTEHAERQALLAAVIPPRHVGDADRERAAGDADAERGDQEHADR